jgi:hypothetical protein
MKRSQGNDGNMHGWEEMKYADGRKYDGNVSEEVSTYNH